MPPCTEDLESTKGSRMKKKLLALVALHEMSGGSEGQELM